MTMVWVGAAVAVAFVLLLVVRAMSAEDEAPVPAKATPATGRTKAARADERDAEEPEGTKVASVPPPPHKPETHAVVADEGGDLEIAIAAPDNDDPTGPVPLILVEAVGRTDPGKRRKHNEDAYLVLPESSLFVIADGMGGYAAGEVASQLAVEVIGKAFRAEKYQGEPDPGLPRRGDELVRAIRMANLAILEQARQNEAQTGMGTTIVAARFSPNKQRVYISHVGDSRAYRIRNGEMKQLTLDHTLGAAGIVGPSAAKLSRAVGIGDSVDVDLLTDSPHPGDHYMLCCDGLNKMVPDDVMKQIILRDKDLDRAANALIDMANERGGRDNITVILIRVDEPKGLKSS